MSDVAAPAAAPADKAHAALMAVGGLATAAYWIDWFTGGNVRTSEDQAYTDFEQAFVLADTYMAGMLLVAAQRLWSGREDAVGMGIAAGSAVVFLGLMDLLYDLQHRKFAARTPEMAIEKAIVAACLAGGPFTMLRLWRARRRLAG